jgi:hypothetical protein
MDNEKFLNVDEMMVDYAEMTSYSFGNKPYWNVSMAEDEEENTYTKQAGCGKYGKYTLSDLLHNMVAKFSFKKAEA